MARYTAIMQYRNIKKYNIKNNDRPGGQPDEMSSLGRHVSLLVGHYFYNVQGLILKEDLLHSI